MSNSAGQHMTQQQYPPNFDQSFRETIHVTGVPRTAAAEGARFSLVGGTLYGQTLHPYRSQTVQDTEHPGHCEGRFFFNGFSQIVL